MKRANGRFGIGLAVALALLAAAGAARAAVNVYQVGSGQTYTTVQSALNVARTNNANGDTQVVRIMDSGGYTNENLVLTGTWQTRKLVLEANAGQTPTLFAITLAQTIGEVTLSGLKFKSPKASTSVNGGVDIQQQSMGASKPVTVTNCNFEQTGNATGAGWVNGVYVRASASATHGKVTVASCHFDMTAGAASLVSAGVVMYAGNNYANVEVTDCVFLGGYRGIYDPNTASSMMVALNIHNNLFHSQNFAGYNNNQNDIDYAYLAIENNTFVKIYDRHTGYESGGAIAFRSRTDLSALVIKDNLIVDDMDSTLCAGFSGYQTAVTALNADYNAFVAMTGNKVGYWNSLQKTLADLNGLTGAGNNIENDTLTPANLFANYGGTDYRNDYRLKVGVWALTAASDSSYVGAFGQQLPVVTVTANDNTATEAGTTTGQFTVGRGTRTDGALAVNFTLSGSATPGGDPNDYTLSFSGTGAVDYTAKTGSVTIADGATNATVTVTPFNDSAVESDETVVLTLSSQAGYIVGSPSSNTVTITSDDVGNLKPVVDAGPNKNVISNSLPASTGLEGSATDPDNRPTSPMTYLWAKLSGSGAVTFGDATVTNTSASFATAGAYVLSLSAYDGADTGSNTVTITVYSNAAPVVDAGVGQTITLAAVASLDGTLTTDDGLPGPPTYLWTKDSGPGDVTFGNSSLIDTTATFAQLGAYVLRLTATDGLGLSGSDTVSINVRDVIVFTATNSARFNVAGTWDPAGGPPMAGDTAVISNVTVSTLSAGEVPAGVTVSLLDTGVLWCADSGSAVQPIASNATINIASGATLRVDNRNTIVGTNNLSGGTLSLSTDGEVGSGCTLNVNADSVVKATSAGSRIRILGKATGTGKLTVTGTPGSTTGNGISLAVGSTWSGAWDVQDGVLRFSGDAGQQILPGDLRVADGATAEQTGDKTIIGTRSGGGTNAVYQNAVLTIGNGTANSPGRGWLSPGDAGVNGGVGRVTVASYSSGYGPTLRFASNSTCVVDIRGTTSALYDAVSVVGNGAGTGKVDIVTGAILTVSLWTPPGAATLNAKIIDTAIGTGGDGTLTGAFTVTNWLNSAGWRNLNVSASNGDLFVTGEYPPSGTVMILR